MTFFDEQPDGDIHGECAAEIAALHSEINEQARLLGMSGVRESKLCAKIVQLARKMVKDTNTIRSQAAALAKAREALEGVCDSYEECENSDGWTAIVISLDALHEAQEALAAIDAQRVVP